MAAIPPSWINSEFLEKALRSNGKHPDVRVISFDIKRAALAGDHYGSEMYRATVKTRENGNTEETSVIIKLELTRGQLSETVKISNVFMQEVNAFTDVHGALSAILEDAIPDLQPFAAKCIYVHHAPQARGMVLEDLKTEGFRLANVSLGLDLKHCQLVLGKIAQYHAASIVLHEKNPNCFQKFLSNFYNSDSVKKFEPVVRGTIRSCAEMISTCPGYEKYVDVLHSLEDTLVPDMRKAIAMDDSGYNVLNHGDLWLNNIMFRYNEDSQQVQDVRFVDYQLSYYSSPVVDLFYFLIS
ncbi:hypothetical protein L9F63_027852, partial [Diploptera punctata]